MSLVKLNSFILYSTAFAVVLILKQFFSVFQADLQQINVSVWQRSDQDCLDPVYGEKQIHLSLPSVFVWELVQCTQ